MKRAQKGKAEIGLLFLSAASFIVVLVFDYYSLIANTSGHTGFNPYYLFAVFIPLAILAIVMIVLSSRWKKSKKILQLSIILLVIQIIGLLNVYLYDVYGIMVLYETASRRGLL